MAVNATQHPLVQHKLGLLREKSISTKDFRQLCAEISNILVCEATRDLPLENKEITSWSGDNLNIKQIKGRKMTVVPIMRAGAGMCDGVMQVIPNAIISMVGFYRDEETLQAVPYMAKLAPKIDERFALIVDPMLATGGTLIATIDLLKEAGCKNIRGLFLVAAPEGLAKLEEAHPDVELFVAAVDEKLNENGFILPGLGDAGDKIFGTR